jgi:hypothetical protein
VSPVPSASPAIPAAKPGPTGSAPSPVAPPVLATPPQVPALPVTPPIATPPTLVPPSATPTPPRPVVSLASVSASITPPGGLTNNAPVPTTSPGIASPTHPLNAIQSSTTHPQGAAPAPTHPLNTIQAAPVFNPNPTASFTPAPTHVYTPPGATVPSPPQPQPLFTPARDEPQQSGVSTRTMPLFELGRRAQDAAGSTLPGVQNPNETLPGGSRADVVDIPLDDLEDPPAPTSPTARTGREADEAMSTANWNPPNYGVAHEVIPLSPEAFQRLLPRFSAVRTRDEVTDLLLDFLAEGFSRVIMFTHIKGEIRGRDARGEDLMVDAVRQIRIPATGPSLFSSVIDRHMPYFGPMRTDTAIDAAFFGALGGVEGVVLCLPVMLRDKVPLLVFASGSHNPVDPRSLQDLTNEVSAALERLIVTEKNRSR